MTNKPKLSIIIPVYNTEKYLYKCLESIRIQTYKDFEVIIVNDCTTDNSLNIINKFIANDNRFKLVNHTSNKGLFQARITGFLNSKGDYIAHVDSDDYISIDWFRSLVIEIEKTQSDIVIADCCFEYTNTNKKTYYTLDTLKISNYTFENIDVIDNYMKEKLISSFWSVVWNKIYTRNLWEKLIEGFIDLSNKAGHIVMWEDVIYTSALFMEAKKITTINNKNNYYFYCQHSSNSTNFSDKSHEYKVKFIENTIHFYNFFKLQLKEHNLFEKYKSLYLEWQHLGIHYIYTVLQKEDTYIKIIQKKFNLDDNYDFNKKSLSSEFHKYETTLDKQVFIVDEIKKSFNNSTTSYICFDIFEVLVQNSILQENYIGEENIYITREFIFELYELAIYLNKKIIFNCNSDMEKDIVKNILNNTKYNLYNSIYFNTDYNSILKDLNINENEIVFILNSCSCNHSKNTVYYIPSTLDLLKNKAPNIYTGNIYSNILKDLNLENKNIELQKVYGLIKNKFYDNPYTYTYKENSDFNLNPYNLGYAGIGSHLLGVCTWLNESLNIYTQNNNYKIYFISDMYLYKEAFNLIYDEHTDLLPLDFNKYNNLNTCYKNIIGNNDIIICNGYTDEIEKIFNTTNIINIENFYNSTPKVTGFLREHIFYEVGHYTYYENNTYRYDYKKEKIRYHIEYMMLTVQKGALDFIKDYYNFSSTNSLNKYYKELSAIFEYFLNSSNIYDRSIYLYSDYKNLIISEKDKEFFKNWVFKDIIDFINTIGKYNNIACFGGRYNYDDIINIFIYNNLELPRALCDNNKSKHGTNTREGIPIISFDDAINLYDKLYILITSSKFEVDIRKQILEKLTDDRIFYFEPNSINLYLEFILL